MADIRINALPTTATDFASDDYIAIDGTTNGTRKLNAKTANLTFSDVTLGSSGPSVKSTLSARAPRQGLIYDGTTSSSATLSSAIGTSDFSASVWFQMPPSSSAKAIFSIGSFGNARSFNVYVDTGVLNFVLFGATGGDYSNAVISGVDSLAGKYVQLSVTRVGSALTAYINGIATAFTGTGGAGTQPTFADTITSTTVSHGGMPNFYFVGMVGQLYIYNRALSASEVVALYESGAPNPADIGYVSGISPAAWAPGFSSPTVTSSSGSSVTATGQYGASFSTLLGTVGAVPVTVVIDVTASNITSAKAYFANSAADSSGVAVSSVITLNQGRNVINLKRSTSATTYLCVEIAGGVTTWTFTGTNITVGRGLLLAPDAAQAGGGLVWYDTSGNAANITLPASGVSWNVPSSSYWGGNLNVNGTGTSSVAGGLTLLGSKLAFSDDGTNINATATSRRLQLVATGSSIVTGYNTDFYFSNETSVAKYNGNLGIGITNPTARLHVSVLTGAYNSSIAKFEDTWSVNSLKITNPVAAVTGIQAYPSDAPSSTIALALNPSGSPVLIGKTTPDTGEKLQVNGTATFKNFTGATGILVNSDNTSATNYPVVQLMHSNPAGYGGRMAVDQNGFTLFQYQYNGGAWTDWLQLNSNTGNANFLSGILSVSVAAGSRNYLFNLETNDQAAARLRFTNTGSGGKVWSLVGGNPGANNADFTIYDESNALKALVLKTGTGDATFAGDINLKSVVTTPTVKNILAAGNYSGTNNVLNSRCQMGADTNGDYGAWFGASYDGAQIHNWVGTRNNGIDYTLIDLMGGGSPLVKLGGALRLNNAYTAGAPTATGYVTIQDSAGNTYKVLVGT